GPSLTPGAKPELRLNRNPITQTRLNQCPLRSERTEMLRCRKASLCDKKRHLRSLCNDQFSRGGCSGLRRRNLEGGFVLYLERHRARDKAFLRGGIVQAARDVLIRAGSELGVRPQRDAFELSGAVRPLDLHAESVIAVCHNHDSGVGAKVQIPELMTGGKRRDEELRGIPSRRVAAKHRVGRAGYRPFCPAR